MRTTKSGKTFRRNTLEVCEAALKVAVWLVATMLPACLSGVEVIVGRQSIAIPSPTGFAEVTSVDPDIAREMVSVCPTSNVLRAVFWPEDDVIKLLNKKSLNPVTISEKTTLRELLVGKPFAPRRTTNVQTLRSTERYEFSLQNFTEMRKAMREQCDSLYNKWGGRKQLFVDGVEQRLAAVLGKKITLKVGSMLPLGIADETPTSITHVVLTKVSFAYGDDHTEEWLAAGATTLVLVSGKTLFVGVSSPCKEKADLDWVRTAAMEWRKQIEDANASKKR